MYFSVRVSILHPPDTTLTHADRLDHDFLPSHIRVRRRSRAHPPNAPNTAHSRRSSSVHYLSVRGVRCGLLVARPSSLFAHPPSQPTGAQTAPRRPTRPRKLHTLLRTYVPDRLRLCTSVLRRPWHCTHACAKVAHPRRTIVELGYAQRRHGRRETRLKGVDLLTEENVIFG